MSRILYLLNGLFALTIALPVYSQPLLVTVQQAKGEVAVFDLQHRELKPSIVAGYKPHEITYDPVRRLCYVSNFGVEDYDTKLGIPGKSISVIDPFKGTIITTIATTTDTAGNMPHGVKLRPGAYSELFVNIEKGDSMLVYALPSYSVKRKFAVPAGTHNFMFSKNGRRLWLMCGSGGVVEIDPGSGTILHSRKTSSPVRGLSFIGADLLASGKNEIFILSSKDLSVQKHFDRLGTGQLFYSSATDDAKLLICPAAFDNVVLIIDANNGRVMARLETDKTPLQVQVHGSLAYVTHPLDQHITIIDLKKMMVSGKIDIEGTNGIIFIP